VRDEPNEPTEPNLPFFDATEEAPGAIPVYETTPACNEKGDAAQAEEIRQVGRVAYHLTAKLIFIFVFCRPSLT
jgi:hypothetical protein